MAVKQKPVSKVKSKTAAKSTQPLERVRKLDYKSKKKVARTTKVIPGSFRLLGRVVRHIWNNKKLFGTILIIYALLYILLVKGLAANFQLGETRKAIEEAVGGELGNVGMAAALFGALIGTAGSTSGEAAGVYQTALFLVVSLAIIWALRQTYESREQPRARQAFYQGMYPLIQYILVGLVIILQLLPALIGVTIYGIVTANGIAVGVFEQILWLLFLLMLIGVSIFLVSSSLFASYIVTLPNMTPMAALRSARKLVKFRRFIIIRKVLFLPLVMAIIAAIIFLPLVILLPVVAELLFMIYILLLLIVTHGYFYALYREML